MCIAILPNAAPLYKNNAFEEGKVSYTLHIRTNVILRVSTWIRFRLHTSCRFCFLDEFLIYDRERERERMCVYSLESKNKMLL